METVKRKPNWSVKEKLMLVKEVNDREGCLLGKFAGVGAKGTKSMLKYTYMYILFVQNTLGT